MTTMNHDNHKGEGFEDASVYILEESRKKIKGKKEQTANVIWRESYDAERDE